MKRFEIEHRTRFDYTAPITETVMELRLTPLDGGGQRLLDFSLDVTPRVKLSSYRDGYGNTVHHFNLLRAHRRLSVTSRSLVQVGQGDLEEKASVEDEGPVWDFLRFRPPVTDEPGVRAIARRLRPAGTAPEAVAQALDGLTLDLSRELAYDPAVTNVYSGVAEVLSLRAGVCQDFAHVFIAAARAMGVPARYVSGYIHVPGPDGVTEGASHAWAEAWVPGSGWIGFDATHPVRASDNHIRVAVGRDYRDAAPTRGVYVGTATGTMSVSVRTRPVA
jgi:transglutaminase-like putative cysteine protease